jgi:hypothetical protein
MGGTTKQCLLILQHFLWCLQLYYTVIVKNNNVIII